MNDFSLLIDDDSQFVLAINDELKSYYLKKKMDFYICQSRYDVEKSIEKKSGVGELIIAVLDMWFIDKEKNIAKEDEGYNILKILR